MIERGYNQSIAILGGGAWGTALATLLAEHSHQIMLWCHKQKVADAINTTHANPTYLPGAQLCGHITATSDLARTITTHEWIFVAVPVSFLRDVLEQAKPYATPNKTWILMCKGIEDTTFMLPTQILNHVLGYEAQSVVLAGPNFAQEVCLRQFTATLLASNQEGLANQVSHLLATIYFKSYIAQDVLGIQACSAFKNVLALMYGIAIGAGCQENTKAFLLTEGLREMGTIAAFFGGKLETVYGLAGIGDTILSCTGGLSKNVRTGIAFGQGMTLDTVQTLLPVMAEGMNTLRSLKHLMHQQNLSWPICEATYRFIFDHIPFEQFLQCIIRSSNDSA